MEYAVETFWGLLSLLIKVFCIVVPLMILLEIFKEFDLIDKITKPLRIPARILGFYEESIYPLMAGIIFGLSYGGGVLIGESKTGRIRGSQKFLVALYHGIVVLVTRLLIATVVVGIVSLFIRRYNNKREEIRA
jgi:hypothetical protein